MSADHRAQGLGWRLALLALGIVLLFGCTPTVPPAAVRSTLGPGEALGSDPQDGPLEVRHVAPRGPADLGAQITVVFNRPVRPLANPDAPPPSITIEPELEGKWQWVGSRALRFEPKGGLPPATTFTVSILAGLTAIDGAVLADATTWTFTSAGPRLLRSSPSEEQRHVSEKQPIELTFDQWIEPRLLSDHLVLEAKTPKGTTRIPFELEPELHGRPRSFTVRPRTAWPSDAEITLTIGDAESPADGPGIQYGVVRFRTSGPLRVLGLSCRPELDSEGEEVKVGPATRCDPDAGVTILLSNYVDHEILAEHIRPNQAHTDLSGYGDYTDQGYTYQLTGALKPGKSTRFEIVRRTAVSQLRDEQGHPLEADFSATVQAGDRTPSARIALRGTYGADGSNFQVPYEATNTDDLRLSATRLTPEAVMARLAKRPSSAWGVALRPDHAVPDPPRNQSIRGQVSLSYLVAPGPVFGAVLLSIGHTAAVPEPTESGPLDRDTIYREVQFSNLAVLTRTSHSTAHVWVLDRSSGAPVRGATVTLRRTDERGIRARATTDQHGRADVTFPPAVESETPGAGEKPIAALFVHRGDDWTYTTIGQPEASPLVGTMFTDRGLYRPGETVNIKGIVRQPEGDALVTPVGTTFEGRFVDPNGDDVHRFTATLSEFGTFSTSFVAPLEAPLGRYHVRIERHPQLRAVFQVAEYHPTAFEAQSKLSHDVRVRGDDISCTATGQYLYGSPMVGVEARLSFSRSTSWFSPPGEHKRYTFHAPEGPRSSIVGSPVHTKLDARGRMVVKRTLSLPDMTRPESVSCKVAVSDLDHRVQISESSALVHPGEIYIGLRGPESTLRPSSKFAVDVLPVTPSGRITKAKVTLEIWAEPVDDTGARIDDVLLDTCEVEPNGSASACTFTAPSLDGAEHLSLSARAATVDARGNPIRTWMGLTVEPPPPPPPPSIPSPPEPPPAEPAPPSRYLDIRLDRGSAKVGEVVSARLLSPFDRAAIALLSIERESVLDERIVVLPPGGTTVRLPVTASMVPNVEVQVHAILGNESETTSAELEVAPDAHRLSVKLSPSKTRAAPGDTLNLDLQVTDSQGKPVRAEVTLWGADEGTLKLAHYQTPDPMYELFEPRHAAVLDGDTRRSPLEWAFWGRHRARPPRVRMGATNVSHRNPRQDFRQTVLFEDSLRTDANGRLRRQVKLPDGLTEYRFMAVAITRGDLVGVAEASVTTSQALMARPNLPNVVRAGDRFSANVVLSTKGLPKRSAVIDVEVEGIRTMGASRQTALLAPGVPTAVHFDFAADVVGPYRITVRARTEGGKKVARDVVDHRGEIVAPIFDESALVFGETTGPVAEALGDLSRVRPDVGGLSVQLSRSRLTGLDRGIETLLEYPYGCTEQTASRLLPLVVLDDLARAVGAELPDSPSDIAEASIARLATHQRKDGGFGLWSGSRRSEPWLSAYAIGVLAEASHHGASVDPLTLRRGAEYLQKSLETTASGAPPTASELEAAAASLDALAAMKQDVAAPARSVFEHRHVLSASGRARLLHALAVADPSSDMIPPLRSAVESSIRIDGGAARVVRAKHALRDSSLGTLTTNDIVLDSDVQASALALRALAATDAKHPQVSALAKGLLADRTSRGWGNTHSTAWALIALDAYRRTVPEPTGFDARVFFGADLLRAHTFEEGGPMQTSVHVPMSRLTSSPTGDGQAERLTFDVEGQGRLYYEARLDFARRKLPTQPIDRGFSVIKTMTPASSMADAGVPEAIQAGALVRVDIDVVTSSPRQAVVVQDPLPGGLVAVDPDLGEDVPREPHYEIWDRRELRDDRVLYFVDHLPSGVFRFTYYARAAHPGRYVAPPTEVFEMYAPETRGSTAARSLVVMASAP